MSLRKISNIIARTIVAKGRNDFSLIWTTFVLISVQLFLLLCSRHNHSTNISRGLAVCRRAQWLGVRWNAGSNLNSDTTSFFCKLLDFFQPQFPHLWNENNNTQLPRVVLRTDWDTSVSSWHRDLSVHDDDDDDDDDSFYCQEVSRPSGKGMLVKGHHYK